jgi:hypothetical protein
MINIYNNLLHKKIKTIKINYSYLRILRNFNNHWLKLKLSNNSLIVNIHTKIKIMLKLIMIKYKRIKINLFIKIFNG